MPRGEDWQRSATVSALAGAADKAVKTPSSTAALIAAVFW